MQQAESGEVAPVESGDGTQAAGSEAAQRIVINGESYEVARWAKKHPGGAVILRFLGREATDAFMAFHSTAARKTLKAFRVKKPGAELETALGAEAARGDVERAFRQLREDAEKSGLFVPRPSFFALQGAVVLGLAVAAAVLLALGGPWPLGAILLALCWQQAGWLSHDFCHRSGAANRRSGERWGLFFGNLVMGFSCDWWTEKHNTHHALTNLRGADPDIDTLPLLAFSERDLPAVGPLVRLLVRLQPLTLLPLLAFARMNWLLQSLAWVIRAPDVKRRWTELALLLGHHTWSLAILALVPGWPQRLAFYLLSQLLSGLMTGAVFVVGHSAQPITEEGAEGLAGFHALQIQGTQNITSPRLFRWFFGGLEHQIEHHLFPTMPRHNHHLVTHEVRALSARHGLDYRAEGLFAGLVSVLLVLRRVARAAGSQAPRREESAAE